MIFKVVLCAWLGFLCLEVTSVSGQSPAYCSAPPVTGPCRAAFRRFYFNPGTGKCETFTYGGCGGNKNNFETESACLQTCAPYCNAKPDVGHCKLPIPRFYFNKNTGTCEHFLYGGCGGNSNRYKTKIECLQTCAPRCNLPPDRGPCNFFVPRFYYNPATKTCDRFIYGGCGGNANNFVRIDQCLNTCAPPCAQPVDPGPCTGYFPRFYYDARTKTCRRFIFGGCGGNLNNFQSYLECSQTCEARCFQPKEPGPCYGYFPRFFYNVNTRRCERFIYGGCEGNDNNFLTYRECAAACHINRPANPPANHPANHPPRITIIKHESD